MSKWTQLKGDISKWLSSLATDQVKFCNKLPNNGFVSDGMLTNGLIYLAIEVEAGQKHPDTNTGKYWYWLSNAKRKQRKKVILFHIYTPHFDFNGYGSRMELAKFYVEKMRREVTIEYERLIYQANVDYGATLTKIKAIIRKRAKKEFGAGNLRLGL